MIKTDKAGIYVDLYTLRKLFFQSTFSMTRRDRMIYAEPTLRNIGDCIAAFVMGYEFPDEREKYIKKLTACFTIVQTDLRIMAETGVFKGQRSKEKGYVLMEREIYDYVSRIDEGIVKWRNAYIGQSRARQKGVID